MVVCHFGRVSPDNLVGDGDKDCMRHWNVAEIGKFENNDSLGKQHEDRFVMIRVILLLPWNKWTSIQKWVIIVISKSFIKLTIRIFVNFVIPRISEKTLLGVMIWGERVENWVNMFILIGIEIRIFKSGESFF